jgi:hypothetical protein
VHAEAAALLAQQAEQEWPLGFAPLRQLAWLLTSGGGAAARLRRRRKAAAAAASAAARDFHDRMAAEREGAAVHDATLRHWRWRGLLTDFLHAPAAGGASADRPAILLCHGFGAFSGKPAVPLGAHAVNNFLSARWLGCFSRGGHIHGTSRATSYCVVPPQKKTHAFMSPPLPCPPPPLLRPLQNTTAPT